MADETETPTTELATTTRDKVPVAFAVAPHTLDEAWRWAQAAAKSALVPKSFQGKPADILVAIQMGVEVGLLPMTALQSIAVINGRPGLYGDGLLGLVMASPLYAGHEEYFEVTPDGTTYTRVETLTADDLKRDTTRAIAAFWRRGRSGQAQTFARVFSIADAKRAGLWTKDGPWQTYPARMLGWRALAFAIRAAFPDVLKGLRTVDELEDIPADPAPVDLPPPVVRRKSDPAPPTPDLEVVP